MRSGAWAVIALVLACSTDGLCADRAIGEPIPVGPRALEARMARNPEIAAYVMRYGYPDWAEEAEVDSLMPLAPYETRLYYLRLDREVTFTEAYILGRREIGLVRYERPISAEMRERIACAYIASDPARRAELAAERATVAADGAERAADHVLASVARAERYADEMERSFHRGLRK